MAKKRKCATPKCRMVYPGEKYGLWTVLAEARSKQKVPCQCDCGTTRDVVAAALLDNASKSCGCTRAGKERPSMQKKPFVDLTGRRFGKLLVVGYSHREKSRRMWKCLCECGVETLVKEVSLEFGCNKSCGCSQFPGVSIGEKYGSYLVLSEGQQNDATKRKMFLCRCDCGSEHLVSGTSLRTGRQPRCFECAVTTHGLSKTPMYRLYTGIKARCYSPSEPAFKHYGGRGIAMCDRWLNSFENFLADMGERPSKKHSIDRIDVNGDYCPENCRWATAREQNRNKRNNVFIEFNGERLCISDWGVRLGITPCVIGQRLARGLSAAEALDTTKSRKREPAA